MSKELDQLRELAKEAIDSRKKIKLETEKLKKIKDKFLEVSKNKNFSFTIKVDDGSIRAIKNKKNKVFKVKTRQFDKLDIEAKRSLYKSGLLGIKVFLKSNEYEEAFNKNKVPKTLSEIVYSIEKKPFTLSVYIDKEDKKKMIAIEEDIYDDLEEMEEFDDEEWDDLMLNIYPLDYEHFTDNDPADLSEIEKQDLGYQDEEEDEDDK